MHSILQRLVLRGMTEGRVDDLVEPRLTVAVAGIYFH